MRCIRYHSPVKDHCGSTIVSEISVLNGSFLQADAQTDLPGFSKRPQAGTRGVVDERL